MLNNCTQRLTAANPGYGAGVGDGEELFFVVSFFVVEESVDDFFLVVVDDFLVVDSVLAGAFDGAVVVVDSDLVVHELMSPAASKTVME
ncbi:MAG: hypothetical protein QOJ05_976 [Verrucomicrobiota bacterium]